MNILTDVYDMFCGVVFHVKKNQDISLAFRFRLSFSSCLELLSSAFLYCSRMKGVRDWVFSQILSKSLVSPSSLSGGNSFYAEEHRNQNENFNEQGTALILLSVFDFKGSH